MDQTAQVLQRLQLLKETVTEQLHARRGAEHALVEAQTRIAQLDQALHQGARPAVSVGQVVDTRGLGTPDKWDGSERAWPNWSFVMKAYAGAIDHDQCRDQYGRVEQRPHDASEAAQVCAVVLRYDRVVHWQSRVTHRQCSAWLEHGAVAYALSSVFHGCECCQCRD